MIRTQHLNFTGLRGIKYSSDSSGGEKSELKEPFLLCKELELVHAYQDEGGWRGSSFRALLMV